MRFSTVRRGILSLTLAASAVAFSGPAAHAQLTGFVNNPSSNSTDFSTFVTGLGGALNTNVNFDAHPTGALQSNFYLGSDGVTITTTDLGNTVNAGAGPNQGNGAGANPGEGPHPASNHLNFSSSPSNNVTFSFDTPISAFGLFTIDLFNPSNDSIISISAFTGQNGTGTLLGSFDSVAQNFQSNNLYFEGLAVTDGSNTISSVVVSRTVSGSGDVSGLDDVRFARSAGITAAPEPGTLALLTMAALPLGAVAVRRRHKKA